MSGYAQDFLETMLIIALAMFLFTGFTFAQVAWENRTVHSPGRVFAELLCETSPDQCQPRQDGATP